MMPTLEQTRAEFHAERMTGVGGSDIHKLFSLEPYGCARQLWYEKTGAEPEFESYESRMMTRGKKLEPIVADEYEEKTGRTVQVTGTLRHASNPEALVHIDRLVTDNLATDARRRGVGVLEIKTAGREEYFRMKRQGLNQSYILQLQHGMLCSNLAWGSFALFWPDGWQLLYFDVERDEALCSLILDGVAAFWKRVQAMDPPERLNMDDPRCNRCPYQLQCQGAVMAEVHDKAVTMNDPSLAPLVSEFLEAKGLSEEAEENLEGVREELRCSMGNRTIVDTPVGKIHFNPQMEWDLARLEKEKPAEIGKFRVKYDLTKFGEAHPELDKEYKRVGTTRPLRVYPKRGA